MATEYIPGSGKDTFVIHLQDNGRGDLPLLKKRLKDYSLVISTEDNDGLIIRITNLDIVDKLLVKLQGYLNDTGFCLIETRLESQPPKKEKEIVSSFKFKSFGQPDNTTIILESGNSFGSGHHPSTALALQLLEELVVKDLAVFDVGCGSAILALVAKKMGAGLVVGLDIDHESLAVAKRNIANNKLAIEVSEYWPTSSGLFDLVLANVTGAVLTTVMANISSIASNNSLLIISGLQGRQLSEATKSLGEYDWQLKKNISEDKWQAALYQRSI